MHSPLCVITRIPTSMRCVLDEVTTCAIYIIVDGYIVHFLCVAK